jgi:hypothetical protein
MEAVVQADGSPATTSFSPARTDSNRAATPAPPGSDLPAVATELLAIAGYVAADDGPLQPTPAAGRLSPWHEPVLSKALERLQVIDAYLRGRVAFFVAGKDHGYGSFDGELALAAVALDTCRTGMAIVEDLLAGRRPSVREFDLMGDSALSIYAALETIDAGQH